MTRQEMHAQYGPKLICPLPGPKARAAIELDEKLISPSYTRGYPLVAESGKGVRIRDVDGNEFLDFAAGIAVASTGHCHPKVVDAIKLQAEKLIHISSTDFYLTPLTDLASRLSAVAPMQGPHKIFYGNSGAEAIECALKLARYHTGRQNVIAFLGAFHGRTMGALSLTASKPQQKRKFAPLVPGVTHVPYPYAYRNCPGTEAEQAAYALQCARYIEDVLFKKILPPEEVAAIFVEPIQGEGGYVPAPKNFMQELRAICDRHGILLVVDEVQSGVGRTGKWWAVQETGVEPDILCTAKGIASGMPLSVCMAKASVMDWVPGSHASTFGGNPVAIAAAVATMDLLSNGVIENAAKVGAAIKARLEGWKKTHPMVGDVRGRCLMIGLEMVKDQQSRQPAPEQRNLVELKAFEKGLMILGCGENTLRFCPPLIITEEEAMVALDILEDVLTEIEQDFFASQSGKEAELVTA